MSVFCNELGKHLNNMYYWVVELCKIYMAPQVILT